MKYNAVIFDLDGTLLDTLDDLKNSVNHALGECGLPPRTRDDVRGFVGNGIRRLLERSIAPENSDMYIEKALPVFRKHYGENCRNETKPYDGIIPMLEKLKENGIKTAIVSNKADFAVKELADYFFGGLISAAVGEREGTARKPAPDSVFAVLSELGESAESAVYVGDSDVDILTARNAGLTCISVSWGFKGVDFLKEHNADIIIDSPSEIFEHI